MKQKIQLRNLIIACVVILGGLVSIQYYLIQNTYNLTKTHYLDEVKEGMKPVFGGAEMDSIKLEVVMKIQHLLIQKSFDIISQEEYELKIEKLSDSIRVIVDDLVESNKAQYPILRDINFRGKILNAVLLRNGKEDTLISLREPLVYMGKDFSGEGFNQSTSSTRNIFDINDLIREFNEKYHSQLKEQIGGKQYNFILNQSIDYDISNWKLKVLKKMSLMLIAAVGLILAVILLFFWMCRSLIKQKKIAQIKTDFANNITHELKTPLASLSLIVKTLKNDIIMENPESRAQTLQALERQSLRIQYIVDRVLESSIRQQVLAEEADMVQFLNNIVLDYNSKTHRLEAEINPDSLMLKTDYHQLGRVIHNLLENAEKYSPNADVIQLKSYEDGGYYVIEIKDFGIGIAEKERNKIFDKFYRINKGNTHDVKGLGLGLFLSKEIVNSLGGNISIQSKLGQGSTFTVKIPSR